MNTTIFAAQLMDVVADDGIVSAGFVVIFGGLCYYSWQNMLYDAMESCICDRNLFLIHLVVKQQFGVSKNSVRGSMEEIPCVSEHPSRF